jgi:transposase
MDCGGTQTDESVAAKREAEPAPFDLVMVSIPKSEYIGLKDAANRYKELHQRALRKIVKLLDLLAKRRAQVRDLQHRYFKRGRDKASKKQEKQGAPVPGAAPRRPRGQQKGSDGHGKAPLPDVPMVEETLDLSAAEKASAGCQEPLKPGPDRVTWILEFRLVAYLRKIVRKTSRVPRKPKGAKAPEGQTAPAAEGMRVRDEAPVTDGPMSTTAAPVAADVSAGQQAMPAVAGAAAGREQPALPGAENTQVQEAERVAAEGAMAAQAGAAAAAVEPVKQARLIAPKRPARLIPRGLLGVSVWVEILLWKFHHMIPMNRMLQMLRYLGVSLPAGTIDGGLERLAKLFEPLLEAFKLQQLSEQLFHADETFWRVFEKLVEKVGYRWYLWTFISPSVCFYILDPSRSAKVPLSHFGALLHQAILMADRYSAYKKLPKTLSIVLAFCWAHVRRDWIELARGYPKLEAYAQAWVERIGTLYHLNKQRLKAGAKGFDDCDRKLREHVKSMADQWAKDLAAPKLHPAARKCLESMQRHWRGLTVFVEYPEVDMDNNRAERMLRPACTGRKAFYGSGAAWSAHLAASLFTIFMTLVHCWKINPRHWLTEYLNACADNGGHAPQDLSRFLPWQLAPERLAQLRKPLPMELPGLKLAVNTSDCDERSPQQLAAKRKPARMGSSNLRPANTS